MDRARSEMLTHRLEILTTQVFETAVLPRSYLGAIMTIELLNHKVLAESMTSLGHRLSLLLGFRCLLRPQRLVGLVGIVRCLWLIRPIGILLGGRGIEIRALNRRRGMRLLLRPLFC